MDTSFIFHPTYGARVSVFSASSLTSYLLQQLRRVAPSWALPLPPSPHPLHPHPPSHPPLPPLRPSFLLSLTLRRRLDRASCERKLVLAPLPLLSTSSRLPPRLPSFPPAVSLCFSYFSSPAPAATISLCRFIRPLLSFPGPLSATLLSLLSS